MGALPIGSELELAGVVVERPWHPRRSHIVEAMDGRDRVAELARESGLGPWADQLAAVALPSARILLDDGPGELLGARLGGDPAMPSGFEWPMRNDGGALAFVGQIRLEEVARLDIVSWLPDSGMLSVFYDADDPPWSSALEDRARWRVVWFADLSDLEARRPPADLAPSCVFTPHVVRYRTEWTLPCAENNEIGRILGPCWPPDPIVEPRYAGFFELGDRLRGHPDGVTHVPTHRLFGHPDQVQNAMPADCEMLSRGLAWESSKHPDIDAELKRCGRDWRLLLQVDTDGRLGTDWGDTGVIYYWIKEADAAGRAFDRAWVILQSC